MRSRVTVTVRVTLESDAPTPAPDAAQRLVESLLDFTRENDSPIAIVDHAAGHGLYVVDAEVQPEPEEDR